jgi:hypothetical protein
MFSSQVDLPADKLTAVHGTVAVTQCEFCRTTVPPDEFRESVRCNIKDIYKTDPSAPAESTLILCAACQRPGVKPATILYGCNLSPHVFKNMDAHLPLTDLMFVCGTSLTVSPSSSIPLRVPKHAARVLINLQPVGDGMFDFSAGGRDVFLSGSCDAVCVALASELGWLPDLARFMDSLPAASAAVLKSALQSASTSEAAMGSGAPGPDVTGVAACAASAAASTAVADIDNA